MVYLEYLKACEELGCALGSAPPGQAPVSVPSTSFVPQLCVVVTPWLNRG